jgi:hypothetical protein
MTHKADLREQAEKLGPWLHEFEVDGQSFGGDTPRERLKPEAFREFLDGLDLKVRTILEMGSHEGSHTLQLAEIQGVKNVVGLEGRSENIARANFVKEVFRGSNVEFHPSNLDAFDPDAWPQFDAVFCSGLLYHLERPWDFISKISKIATKCVFIDTHYAGTADTEIGNYSGIWHTENKKHPSSGLVDQAFHLSFRDLIMIMMANGLLIHRIVDVRQHPNGPRAWFIATKSDLVNASPAGGWNHSRQGVG